MSLPMTVITSVNQTITMDIIFDGVCLYGKKKGWGEFANAC